VTAPKRVTVWSLAAVSLCFLGASSGTPAEHLSLEIQLQRLTLAEMYPYFRTFPIVVCLGVADKPLGMVWEDAHLRWSANTETPISVGLSRQGAA
jgi:hypothetical protein